MIAGPNGTDGRPIICKMTCVTADTNDHCFSTDLSHPKRNQKQKNFAGLLTSIACIASLVIPSEISQGTNRHNI